MKDNPQHIAIIMDGNSRWAKKRGLSKEEGHKQGAEAARRILIACLKLKIPYLTLYTFSYQNWKRDNLEVANLFFLFKYYLSNELHLLVEQNIRVKIIGDRSLLPKDIINLINHCEEVTKDNSDLVLQIALSYGGREEIIQAQKSLLLDVISDKLKVENLDEEVFRSYLYTSSVPDPDLLIRTSGEFRISNFLLWQLAYTEFYFTKTLWPDFNATNLRKAISNYKKRERRYGLSK